MKLKSDDGTHDCIACGCDVSWDGYSITGHEISYVDPVSGRELKLNIAKGEKMPRIGKEIPAEAARGLNVRVL